MTEISLNLPSCALLRPVEIRAALPYGFGGASPPFRVVWALHCAMADGGFFFNQLGAGKLADQFQTAIIAPALGNGFFFDSARENQGEFLEEMLSALRELLPLSCLKEDNAVLGFSMGGFGALRWALASGHFCRAVAISGVFDCRIPPDEKISGDRNQKNLYRIFSGFMRDLMLAADGELLPACDLAKIAASSTGFVDLDLYCGDSDYLSLPQTLHMEKLAAAHGLPAAAHLGQGGHGVDYWSEILPIAIKNIFRAFSK